MTALSPRLRLPYLQPAQAQKHVTHNEALQVLDTEEQLRVLAWDVVAPRPFGPSPATSWPWGPAPPGPVREPGRPPRALGWRG
jgi:hypothetical protein